MILAPRPGGFCIPWVVDSIEKRRDYSESRRKNREGKTVKKPNNISSSYVPHMENENEIVNEDINTIEDKIKNALDEIYLEQQKSKWPHLDFMFEYRTFCEKVRGSPKTYASRDSGGIRLAFQSQLRNAKTNGKYSRAKETPADLATAFANRVMQDAARGKLQGDQ